MFRCDSCNVVVPAGTRETKITVETRTKVYEARGGMTRDFPRQRRQIGRRARRQASFDKGGTGTEIVREISVCPKCAAEYQARQAEEQALLAAQKPDVPQDLAIGAASGT